MIEFPPCSVSMVSCSNLSIAVGSFIAPADLRQWAASSGARGRVHRKPGRRSTLCVEPVGRFRRHRSSSATRGRFVASRSTHPREPSERDRLGNARVRYGPGRCGAASSHAPRKSAWRSTRGCCSVRRELSLRRCGWTRPTETGPRRGRDRVDHFTNRGGGARARSRATCAHHEQRSVSLPGRCASPRELGFDVRHAQVPALEATDGRRPRGTPDPRRHPPLCGDLHSRDSAAGRAVRDDCPSREVQHLPTQDRPLTSVRLALASDPRFGGLGYVAGSCGRATGCFRGGATLEERTFLVFWNEVVEVRIDGDQVTHVRFPLDGIVQQ